MNIIKIFLTTIVAMLTLSTVFAATNEKAFDTGNQVLVHTEGCQTWVSSTHSSYNNCEEFEWSMVSKPFKTQPVQHNPVVVQAAAPAEVVQLNVVTKNAKFGKVECESCNTQMNNAAKPQASEGWSLFKSIQTLAWNCFN